MKAIALMKNGSDIASRNGRIVHKKKGDGMERKRPSNLIKNLRGSAYNFLLVKFGAALDPPLQIKTRD